MNFDTGMEPTHHHAPAVVEPQEPQVTAFHDLIAGGVAGCASVVVGHPFDTIKVRLQTGSGSANLSSVSSSFGGISSLFRGMAAPLSTAAVVNALIFSAYGTSSRVWDKIVGPTPVGYEHDPWQKAFVCGSFAGFVQSMVICPMEHLKCRLQVQHGKGSADNLFKGPTDAAKSIFRSHGIRGLYRGYVVTMWREIPAFGAYFSVYDIVKDRCSSWLAERAGEESTSHTWIASAFAGGVTGSVTWFLIYPMDIIKTRIQTAPLDAPVQMVNMGVTLVRKHGWRYMFRGLGITLIRAFPVNGIIFPVYEFTLIQIT
mmetsp:Transcript_46829/g.69643  ORF Transcript_46829/g.69643 Transcript_46829/m.69643 type:complete len:314 (-) Transcript_46829:1333-2274(-)